MELAVEGSAFANMHWNGRTKSNLEVVDCQGQTLGSDRLQMRVAPLILLPNAAPTQELYVSAGHPNYENSKFREQAP